MNGKPARPWFQIHLSTAIVVMLIASGIVWLNLSVRGVHTHKETIIMKFEGGAVLEDAEYEAGWPLPLARINVSHRRGVTPSDAEGKLSIDFNDTVEFDARNPKLKPRALDLFSSSPWNPTGLVANTASAMVLMLICGTAIEFVARRLESQRAAA